MDNFKVYWNQLKSVLIHKWYVLKIGLLVGGIPLWRLIIHDISKFSFVEFINYARWFHGIKSIDGWAKAWLHHQHCNPHHPEYWVLSWRGDPDFYAGIGDHIAPNVVILVLPETYVREMVVDMIAYSKTYTGSYDIRTWLDENLPKMRLHNDTIARFNGMMLGINQKLYEEGLL